MPDLVLEGEHYLEFFGNSVSSAGDVNGDGVPDIIVGNGQIGVEKAYLYFGGAVLDDIPDLILVGPTDSNFGWRVGSAGDVNGDGYDDAIVSAHWYTEDPGTTQPGYGRAYIYYGGVEMDSIPDVILSGTYPLACFGLSFSSMGDLNYDGFGDIVVSAHCSDTSPAKARVFLGGPNMVRADTLADAVIEGEAVWDFFSYSLSGTHDLNGDIFNELIVGAPFYDLSAFDEGKVYVYSILPGLTITSLTLSKGVVGFSYVDTLSVYDGTPPHDWGLCSGALPDGLELKPDGTINGIPTTVGATSFGVRVTDAEGETDTQDLSIEIVQGTKGDVNFDGAVNVLGVVRVVNIILTLPPTPTEYELWAGDCNEDGRIDILDAICIVNMILS